MKAKTTKHQELIEKFGLETAKLVVDQIIDALENYDKLTEEYLKEQFGLDYFSSELQNMDSDFRFWAKVKRDLIAEE